MTPGEEGGRNHKHPFPFLQQEEQGGGRPGCDIMAPAVRQQSHRLSAALRFNIPKEQPDTIRWILWSKRHVSHEHMALVNDTRK